MIYVICSTILKFLGAFCFDFKTFLILIKLLFSSHIFIMHLKCCLQRIQILLFFMYHVLILTTAAWNLIKLSLGAKETGVIGKRIK